MSLLQSSCICGQVRPETGEEGKERDMGGLHECHDISKGQHWHPREPALGEESLGASQHCSGTAVGGLGRLSKRKSRHSLATLLCGMIQLQLRPAPSLAAALSVGFWGNISSKLQELGPLSSQGPQAPPFSPL